MSLQSNRAMLSNELIKNSYTLLKNEINIISFQTELHEIYIPNCNIGVK